VEVMNPFEYVNSINDTKVDIMVDDQAEKAYNSFLVNRSLSYFPDTILLANEMNRVPHIGNRLKFLFFINSVRKRKRFSKWGKPAESDALLIVKEYYGYSNEKARSALMVLSESQIDQLRQRLFKGGHSKPIPSTA
jgi:hypothetical protein